MFHLADREPYSRLNDAVCVCTGEVRQPADPGQAGPDLVIDVAELIWEPIADCHLPPRSSCLPALAEEFTEFADRLLLI